MKGFWGVGGDGEGKGAWGGQEEPPVSPINPHPTPLPPQPGAPREVKIYIANSSTIQLYPYPTSIFPSTLPPFWKMSEAGQDYHAPRGSSQETEALALIIEARYTGILVIFQK